MNNFLTNFWLFNKKSKDILFSYEIKQKGRYIKGSVLAIICGLIIAGIVIAAQDVSPFTFLRELFRVSFSSLFVNQTIQWLCIYIIAGLAVGIGFKSGLFNIGVSGQMLMGAGVSIIFYSLVVGKGNAVNPGYMIVIFLICTFTGAILAGFAGLLKSLFNIHEVVTTIMLNWTAWYLMKYLFLKYQTISGDGIMSSASIPSNSLTIHGSTIAIPIILAGLAIIVVSVILAKTVFGHKLKAVGLSKDASKYAGYNVKTKVVQAMAISGALAGIASFINICTITPNISFSVDNLPSTGYDAIAITLVAFNNPIGIAFTSLLWGILQSGGSSASSLFNMPNQTSSLVFGIIVYFAAIAVVFMEFYPILKLKMMIALETSKKSQIKIRNLRKEQINYRKNLLNITKADELVEFKKIIKDQINEQKEILKNSKLDKANKKNIHVEIHNLKHEMNEFAKEYRKNLKEQIAKINEEIKVIKKDTYAQKINSAIIGINRRRWFAVKNVESETLNKISLAKSDKLNNDDLFKQKLKEKNQHLKLELRKLKKDYKLHLKQNAIAIDGQIGEETHKWIMSNGIVEAKDEISRIKLKKRNQIQNIEADELIAKLDLNSKFRKERKNIIQIKNNLYNEHIKEKEQISNEYNENLRKYKEDIKQLKRNRHLLTKQKNADKEDNEEILQSINENIIMLNKKIFDISVEKRTKIREAGLEFMKNVIALNNDDIPKFKDNKKAQNDLKIVTKEQIKLAKLHCKENIKVQKSIIKELKLDHRVTSKYLKTKTHIIEDIQNISKQKQQQIKQNYLFLVHQAKENDDWNKSQLIQAKRMYLLKLKENKEWYKQNISQNNTDDIKLKYKQNIQEIKHNYSIEKNELNTINSGAKIAAKNVSKENFSLIKETIETYKKNINKTNSIDGANYNLILLKALKENIRIIWPNMYDDTDSKSWSKKRFKVYKFIEEQNVIWVRRKLVLLAKKNIKDINKKAKYTKKMYKKILQEFKTQYKTASAWKTGLSVKNGVNQKANLPAEITYRKQIEDYISKLDKLDFNRKEEN